MKFPFRRKSDAIENYPLPTDLEGPVESQAAPEKRQMPLARIFALVAAVLLLLTILAAGAYWAYTRVNHPQANPLVTTQKQSATSNNNGNRLAQPSDTSKASTPSSSNNTKSTGGGSAAPSTTTTPPQSSSAQPLTNTGPGSTFALFAGTVVVAAALHQLVLRRRLS